MNHDPAQPDPNQGYPTTDGPPSAGAAGQPDAPVPPGNVWFDGDQADSPPAARPHSLRTWLAGGATAVVIAAGAIFGINAASSHSSANAAQTQPGGGFGGRGMGTQGTITAINGSTITVKTASGTSKVTTSASTAVSVAKKGTVAAIATGDHVAVTGVTSGTKIAATQIVDRGKTASATSTQSPTGGQPPGGAAPPGGGPGAGTGTRPAGVMGRPTDGAVTKVDGSTLTIKGTDGKTYTVSTGSSTTVTVESTGTLSDLAAGDTVQVMAKTATSGTGTAISAARIVEGAISDTGFGGIPPAGAGGSSA